MDGKVSLSSLGLKGRRKTLCKRTSSPKITSFHIENSDSENHHFNRPPEISYRERAQIHAALLGPSQNATRTQSMPYTADDPTLQTLEAVRSAPSSNKRRRFGSIIKGLFMNDQTAVRKSNIYETEHVQYNWEEDPLKHNRRRLNTQHFL